MQPYRDLSGRSGVSGYADGPDWIEVAFKTGRIYRYSHASAGADHVAALKHRAQRGHGLASYISQYVRDGYDRRR